jgi:hypothetical protein
MTAPPDLRKKIARKGPLSLMQVKNTFAPMVDGRAMTTRTGAILLVLPMLPGSRGRLP